MSSKQFTLTLADVVGQHWAIQAEAGHALIQSLRNAPLMLTLPDEPPVVYEYKYGYFPSAEKPGSIAVLTINGTLYDFYAQYLCNKLDMIFADPNVSGLLLKVAGPGGSATAGWRMADKLAAAPFPTAVLIDYGSIASAHYLLSCGCDAIYAGRAADRVGSIGVYINWTDFGKYYEKAGIVDEDIYADQSKQKNSEAREAERGNFKPIKALATAEAARFISYVQERRPSLNSKDALEGAMFDAAEGVTIGLLDGIATEREIIKALHGSNPTLSITSNRTPMFGYKKVEALSALEGLTGEALTPALLEAANKELAVLGLTGVALVSATEFAALAEAPSAEALTKANAEVTRLTTELSTANTAKAKLEGELKTANDKIAELGEAPGDAPTSLTAGKDTPPDAGGEKTVEAALAELPHQAQLSGLPWLSN